MLLNCNIQWYERISPAGWVVLPLILAAIIYALYDLNTRNTRTIDEDKKMLEDMTENDRKEFEAMKKLLEQSKQSREVRSGVRSVQLSLL